MSEQSVRSGDVAGQINTLKVAGVVTATILTGFALWALRHILEPFAIALFLLIMVDAMARELRQRIPGFPARLATPAAMLAIVAVFALAIWFTIENASAFTSQSATTARIDALLNQGAQRLGLNVTPTAASLIQRLNPARYAGLAAGALSHIAEAAVFVLIYLGFLVASREGFASKTDALFGDPSRKTEAARVFERIRRGVSSYIWTQTVVGVIITGCSAVLMVATGLSHIPFWCLIIFLANYIPAIGAAIGVLFPVIFGLLEFTEIWRSVVLVVGLEAVHFSVSHVVQPRMQGKSLNVDPIVVLLALTFWGAVWGVAGAFLSTPLAVMAMAILAEFAGTRPLAILLSSDGKPYADVEPHTRKPQAG